MPVSTRTVQGRLLLRPSPELADIILGVIGKAQDIYKMSIHAFVVLSTHAHFLCSPSSADRLASFMQFVNSNIAKEVARLHKWPGRVWSRRYRCIPTVDEEAAPARLRYLLGHGVREGLVEKSAEGPGPNCIALPHFRTSRTAPRTPAPAPVGAPPPLPLALSASTVSFARFTVSPGPRPAVCMAARFARCPQTLVRYPPRPGRP